MSVLKIRNPLSNENHNSFKKIQEVFYLDQNVYIPDKNEGWIKATVVEANFEPNSCIKVKLLSDSTERRVSREDVVACDEKHNELTDDDLTLISPLSVPAMLLCLGTRYKMNKFYTRAGLTLFALNPFQDHPHLYRDELIKNYHFKYTQNNLTSIHQASAAKLKLDPSNKSFSEATQLKKHESVLVPHVYEIAEKAHQKLTQSDQSIVISGESGAGKTVNTKHLMKYLVSVDNSFCVNDSSLINCDHIENKILNSNPILEAFGNAKTCRNHNSSRFGKYIELHFNKDLSVSGAQLRTYLLEKSRVVVKESDNYNFHIFYQLLSNTNIVELKKWLSTDNITQKFNLALLSSRDQVRCHHLGLCADADVHNWQLTREALNTLQITPQVQDEIFKVIGAILHLGNLEFLPDEDEPETSYLSETKDCKASTQSAASLLGTEVGSIESHLVFRTITACHSRRKSVFHKPCTVTMAVARRDCLCKLLYTKLFDWLVKRINETISVSKHRHSIGLLDIYGFESFNSNSLEQLCINYANEKLQQHFVSHFLKDIQEEYQLEAIPWSYAKFTDNKPCLNMLEESTGIFSILNEECNLNRASTDEFLAERIKSSLSNHQSLSSCQKITRPTFTVRHYAGDVCYHLANFLEKNKDDVPSELVGLLSDGSNDFIRELVSHVEINDTGVRKKTVLLKFKNSLDSLMATLQQTQPHYIRCIKPNRSSVAGKFDGAYVLDQLEACGAIETLRISKQCFAAKMSYVKFLSKYSLIFKSDFKRDNESPGLNKENVLDPIDILYKKQLNLTPKRTSTPRHKLRRRTGLTSEDHTRKLCASILGTVFGSDCLKQGRSQFGKTKIFLSEGQLETLEFYRNKIQSGFAFSIQCAWRRHVLKKTNSIKIIQKVIRSWSRRNYILKKLSVQNSDKNPSSQTASNLTSESNTHLPLLTTPPKNICDNNKLVNTPEATPGGYLMTSVQKPSGDLVYNVRSVTPDSPGSVSRQHVFKTVASAITAAFLTQGRFHLSGAFTGIPYLEAHNGILSRRRMPRIKIKFHTRVNPILKNGHLMPKKAFQCSISDCLAT